MLTNVFNGVKSAYYDIKIMSNPFFDLALTPLAISSMWGSGVHGTWQN